jgi:hypothetical protein
MFAKKRFGRKNHARLTKATLERPTDIKSPLQGIGAFRIGHAFNGGNGFILGTFGQRQAGEGGFAIHQHRTGPAIALVTALFAAGQTQFVA